MKKALVASGVFLLLAASGCGLAALTFTSATITADKWREVVFWILFWIGWTGLIGAPIALVVAARRSLRNGVKRP